MRKSLKFSPTLADLDNRIKELNARDSYPINYGLHRGGYNGHVVIYAGYKPSPSGYEIAKGNKRQCWDELFHSNECLKSAWYEAIRDVQTGKFIEYKRIKSHDGKVITRVFLDKVFVKIVGMPVKVFESFDSLNAARYIVDKVWRV